MDPASLVALTTVLTGINACATIIATERLISPAERFDKWWKGRKTETIGELEEVRVLDDKEPIKANDDNNA